MFPTRYWEAMENDQHMKTTIRFKRYIKNDPNQKKEIEFYINGLKYWYLNGKPHREDGPAVEWVKGANKWYYLNGKLCSKKSFLWFRFKKACAKVFRWPPQKKHLLF